MAFTTAALTLAAVASGDEIAWLSAVDAPLLAGSSWAGGVAPDETDGGLFDLPGVYEVQLGEDAEFGYITVDGSSPSFLFPGARLDLAFFGDKPAGVTVGRSPGTTSTLELSIGEVGCDTAVVAKAAGAEATLRVSGATSVFEPAFRLDVGDGGDGTLEVLGGGVVNAGQVFVGRREGAVGSVFLAGAGSELDATFITVGEQGSGALDVSDGGVVRLVGLIAGAATGSGGVTIGDAGSLIDTGVGDALFGEGGEGTLTMSGGGLGARDVVFARAGGDATAVCNGGGIVVSRDVLIGDGGTADAAFGSGHSTVCQRLRVASANNSLATLTLDGTVNASLRVDISPGLFSLGTLDLGATGRLVTPVVRVFSNGTLRGGGTVEGDVDASGGVAPEGVMSVEGDLTFSGVVGQGTLLHTADATANTVDITGGATLAGTFRLVVADGFAPGTGESFVALRAESITGGFNAFDLPDSDWEVEVVGNEVVATYNGAGGQPADLNDDGVVNSTDLAFLLAEWGACAGCASDFDDSGVVDSTDLAFLLAFWSPVS